MTSTVHTQGKASGVDQNFVAGVFPGTDRRTDFLTHDLPPHPGLGGHGGGPAVLLIGAWWLCNCAQPTPDTLAAITNPGMGNCWLVNPNLTDATLNTLIDMDAGYDTRQLNLASLDHLTDRAWEYLAARPDYRGGPDPVLLARTDVPAPLREQLITTAAPEIVLLAAGFSENQLGVLVHKALTAPDRVFVRSEYLPDLVGVLSGRDWDRIVAVDSSRRLRTLHRQRWQGAEDLKALLGEQYDKHGTVCKHFVLDGLRSMPAIDSERFTNRVVSTGDADAARFAATRQGLDPDDLSRLGSRFGTDRGVVTALLLNPSTPLDVVTSLIGVFPTADSRLAKEGYARKHTATGTALAYVQKNPPPPDPMPVVIQKSLLSAGQDKVLARRSDLDPDVAAAVWFRSPEWPADWHVTDPDTGKHVDLTSPDATDRPFYPTVRSWKASVRWGSKVSSDKAVLRAMASWRYGSPEFYWWMLRHPDRNIRHAATRNPAVDVAWLAGGAFGKKKLLASRVSSYLRATGHTDVTAGAAHLLATVPVADWDIPIDECLDVIGAELSPQWMLSVDWSAVIATNGDAAPEALREIAHTLPLWTLAGAVCPGVPDLWRETILEMLCKQRWLADRIDGLRLLWTSTSIPDA